MNDPFARARAQVPHKRQAERALSGWGVKYGILQQKLFHTSMHMHAPLLHPPAAPLDAGPWTHTRTPEVHGPQEHEDAHTVAHPHAASDLSRGVGNDGLLNGGLSLEAVGATDRVERCLVRARVEG